jgi:hypothetical protein
MRDYVTARDARLVEGERHVDLIIPNEEVRHVFRRSVLSWCWSRVIRFVRTGSPATGATM